MTIIIDYSPFFEKKNVSHRLIPKWIENKIYVHSNNSHTHTYTNWCFNMFQTSNPLKNMSQFGSSSQLLGKINKLKKMFQTTKQYTYVYM